LLCVLREALLAGVGWLGVTSLYRHRRHSRSHHAAQPVNFGLHKSTTLVIWATRVQLLALTKILKLRLTEISVGTSPPKAREVSMRASESTAVFGRLPWGPVPAQFHRQSRSQERRVVQSPAKHNRFFEQRTTPTGATPKEISFGPFRLLAAQFLLLEGDKPVSLGSRALEILIALLDRPGELVTKEELMNLIWPNVFVEPANLTVHISALRRVLRDGRDGNRFIINIPGRGYRFVASIQASMHES
jgi:DNA-binding winged helix-turn-helix (wHTH) protein